MLLGKEEVERAFTNIARAGSIDVNKFEGNGLRNGLDWPPGRS
jgi:hypothetical protein